MQIEGGLQGQMKTFGRRNFVAGGAILAASTPWWVTLRNCFGPSGTIHDQKVRVATDDDALRPRMMLMSTPTDSGDWMKDPYEDDHLFDTAHYNKAANWPSALKDIQRLQQELQNEWHRQKMLEREVFEGKTRSELLPNGGVFSNTMGPPITPAQAAVLAVNRVRGTNA